MERVVIMNVDRLYSRVKAIISSLEVVGWDCAHPQDVRQDEVGVEYNSKVQTLLGWFFENITFLKEGCDKLQVARACLEGHSQYAVYEDGLSISTERVYGGTHLLVTLRVEGVQDDPYYRGSYCGEYSDHLREWSEEECYLLKTV